MAARLLEIEPNNQKLLELRKRALGEQNKLQESHGEKHSAIERSANIAAKEGDVTSSAKETVQFDDENLRAIAEVYKNEGNDEYSKKSFNSAIHYYTEGIKVNCKDDDLNAKLYSNRAAAHFNLGNYSETVNDAKVAMELQPHFQKALVRVCPVWSSLDLRKTARTPYLGHFCRVENPPFALRGVLDGRGDQRTASKATT
ncbi:Tetratricopeptide repeat protein 4 [Porites harrisoni]